MTTSVPVFIYHHVNRHRGDTVTITIEKLGTLHNRVAAGK